MHATPCPAAAARTSVPVVPDIPLSARRGGVRAAAGVSNARLRPRLPRRDQSGRVFGVQRIAHGDSGLAQLLVRPVLAVQLRVAGIRRPECSVLAQPSIAAPSAVQRLAPVLAESFRHGAPSVRV
ncbi:MAG: hypothetical protein IPK42_15165 [Betaproteobacteria bacterium]|nr:hypothetical protein [Betaproteobacteria bacterium]